MLLFPAMFLTLADAMLPLNRIWYERRAAVADLGALSGLALLPAKAVEQQPDVMVAFARDVQGNPTMAATFAVPPDWKMLSDTTAAVSGGRRLIVYSSPTDTDWNCFLLLTPVRGDYTSLGSFGTLDSVQDTIIPRGEDIDSKLIASSASSGRYVYEYVISVPGQPKRHLKTIFTLVADTIVTFNIQAREESYTPDVAATSEKIVSSFAVNKRSA